MATYLKDFKKLSKRKIAYLPVGTIEWHGNHLPMETDFLVAQKICNLIAEKKPGYILPPIYLGTDREEIVKGKKLFGMGRYLRKKLPGNLYWLEPETMFNMISSLIKNIKKEGFERIFIVTGHGGSKQIEVLNRIAEKEKGVYLFSPYKNLRIKVNHADEYETSLFWACYPSEEERSRKIKIVKTDDYFNFIGYDPREKATVKIGKTMLKEILDNFLKK